MTRQEPLWQLLGQTTSPRSLLELSMAEGFVPNRRGLRSLVVGISARAWVQHNPLHNSLGSENTVLCEAFYRLARLLKFPVLPVFVFDNAMQTSRKRGYEGQAASQQLACSFRHLVLAFGFHIHAAPAGAEEELAALCQNHLIDVVVTDKISTFMFGATHVMQDREFLNSMDDMVKIYTCSTPGACAGPPLSRSNWILLALLIGNSGGGHGHGLPGCGLATALRIIKSNLGALLFEAAEHMSLPNLDRYLQSWRRDLQHELANDPDWRDRAGHHVPSTQAIGDSFPSPHDILQLVRPITSLSDGQLAPDISLWVPQIPHLGHLGHLCEWLFPWATGPAVAQQFDRHVWHGTCTRLLLTSVVFPADRELIERITTIVKSVTSPHWQSPLETTGIPLLHLVVSTEPLHRETLSQMLNVREELATGNLEPELLPEKQISVPSEVVSLAFPGKFSGAAHAWLPSNPLLFPILREVDAVPSTNSE